jgi:hypothetical protein
MNSIFLFNRFKIDEKIKKTRFQRGRYNALYVVFYLAANLKSIANEDRSR